MNRINRKNKGIKIKWALSLLFLAMMIPGCGNGGGGVHANHDIKTNQSSGQTTEQLAQLSPRKTLCSEVTKGKEDCRFPGFQFIDQNEEIIPLTETFNR